MTSNLDISSTQVTGDANPAREFPFSRDEFWKIAEILKSDAGIHLTEAKMTLVYSRLAKRLRVLGLKSFDEYCGLLQRVGGETERLQLITAMTTNVTRFFREPHHFDHLKTNVLPSLTPFAKKGGRVRFWSSASSTGQEAYSIAMTLLMAFPDAASFDVKILATDIDTNVVSAGRKGCYDEGSMEGLSSDLKNRYFRKGGASHGSNWQVTDELKKLVTFQQLNLHGQWPMKGRFQAIFCRNVAIYFDSSSQQSLWNRFIPAMTEDGVLYIGHSERVTGTAAMKLRSDGITTYRLSAGGPA